VTLFEAGKLNDANVADIVDDLQSVEGTRLEGELQRFADHAFSLRVVLQTLRSGGLSAPGETHPPPNGQTAASPQATLQGTRLSMGDLLVLDGERRLSGGGARVAEGAVSDLEGERRLSGGGMGVPGDEKRGENAEGVITNANGDGFVTESGPGGNSGAQIPVLERGAVSAEGDARASEQEAKSTTALGDAEALKLEEEDWKDFQAADEGALNFPSAQGPDSRLSTDGGGEHPRMSEDLLATETNRSVGQNDSPSSATADRNGLSEPAGFAADAPNSPADRGGSENPLGVSTNRADGGQDSQQSTPRSGTPRSPRLGRDGTRVSKRLRFYVDVLRSESLASLQPSIVQQVSLQLGQKWLCCRSCRNGRWLLSGKKHGMQQKGVTRSK
jgi:hypothetical protein